MCATAFDGFAEEPTTESTSDLVLVSDVEWTPLNPARGDASPQAATLWGDRAGTEATGFLVKFVDGFSSPPHIHNITYRGVVIAGGVHNDDPDAEPMWMHVGAFWTQPAGEPHITAARGTTIAYIEIDKGPYLVMPTEEAFDNGERPVNVDASNIVWLGQSSTSWIEPPAPSATANPSKIAFLWGNPQSDPVNGTLVKLPVGFVGKIRSQGSEFRAVVIEGQANYRSNGIDNIKVMPPGSYFSSKGEMTHRVSCDDDTHCMIYVRSEGQFVVVPD
ncbi:hypothetical protein RMSM_00076 [Rhodopirellula maiorica SM1]|uniref:DUF4437 domain-containing protein n=1 Tax=Rhodopirellula maiorica SM1 TaxID=1265738 RepID=M5RUU8_9BACT|nr:hypothetical protein RMSM_00076 [Rhodopirellula maiorica SM1]